MPYVPGTYTKGSTRYVPGSYGGTRQRYIPSTQTKTTTSSRIKPKSAQIESSAGLYEVARQSGLQRDADRLLKAQSGEDTKKIFSGGFISDGFDALSALQYGVVGMLKGKSFVEGVKTRQSFTDKDALGDNGIPGIIAGTILDIAFDPLTYIAPATVVKKIPALNKALQATKAATFGKRMTRTIEGTDKTYEALEGGSKLGKYMASKVAWMHGADPIFRETFERGTKNIAISTQAIADFGKTVARLAPTTAAKILRKDETGRFARVPLKELTQALSPDELEPVAALYKKIDDLGEQAVDLGILSKETFEENMGTYLKNAYLEFEQAGAKGIFGKAKVGIKGIKKRVEGLTPEKMKELGQIDNPAYLLFKSALDLTRDVENAKMFRSVADNFGADVAQDGFTKLPEGQRLGALSGKYVPEDMATYLNEIIEPAKDTLTKDLVANFKFFKVVMNPGTHARNLMSNTILNWWKLGLGPWRADLYATAIKEARKGGKWVDEAKTVGYNLDTFASQELKSILDGPEAAEWGGKLGGKWQKTKQKLGDMYQAEENVAKLAAFIHQRKKGLGVEEAWKAAESATFNYAQVTPFVRKLRESIFGFPFITFTVKATPVALETIAKNPRRVSAIGKIKRGVEATSDPDELERERAAEPGWVKNGFYVKLPMKDKHGRSAYFDLTYILPFGDLVSGQLVERGTKMETGTPEGIPQALLRKSPLGGLVSELAKNQDFYGNSIWRESDDTNKQLGDIMRHLAKTYLPPPVSDQLGGGYNENGERQVRGVRGALMNEDDPKQHQTIMQELLRNIGAKIQPIDADIQETYQEWNTKKALQRLLIENGILDEFTRTYAPKD